MEYNLLETYLQEADELLSQIEESALSLGAGGRVDETINHLFRAFHTIKGSGAMVGLDTVAAFTHHVETMLDQVRGGAIAASAQLVELVLEAKHQIKLLLSAEQGGAAVPPGSSERLIAAIEEFASAGTSADRNRLVSIDHPVPLGEEIEEREWLLRFRPNPGLLASGGNPAAFLKDLRTLGPCNVTAQTDLLPDLNSLQPDQCYLWWTIALRTVSDENAIRDVFIFVEDDSNLEIKQLEVGAKLDQPVQSRSELMSASGQERKLRGLPAAPPMRRTGDLARESTVRVPCERLDHLVNLVGELVMNQSRLARAAAEKCAPEFTNPVQELERLVAELRDDVLGIRMLPIGTLFGRFRRLVHDLSAELGKQVDLVTEGAETELDKSILDQLGEPLVHCLRNCLDHGVETPAERLAKGKPARATIRLSALHTGSDVVVSVQDDGRGINREAVRAKAMEKQLIAPDARLSDKEVFNLILMPGFSTAREVTKVSGRGVGRDAVKRQIDALRGSLSLSSEAGSGTRVSITLPRTLAIIDGLKVQIGDDQFIIPMAARRN